MEMYTKITSVFCSEQYCFGLFRVFTIDWDSLHAFETVRDINKHNIPEFRANEGA